MKEQMLCEENSYPTCDYADMILTKRCWGQSKNKRKVLLRIPLHWKRLSTKIILNRSVTFH